MRFLARVGDLARKDWKLFLADPRSAFLCFAVPIILAAAFGTIFHRSDKSAMPQLPVHIVCEDQTRFAEDVVRAMETHSDVRAIRTTHAQAMTPLAGEKSGSVLAFGLMALTAALLAATTGLLVAALGNQESRARSLSILVILGLSFSGGLWLPSFLLPEWAQRLSLALPTTWAAQGFERVTQGCHDIEGVLPHAGMLLGFSLVFLLMALWRFRHCETRWLLKGDG